MKQGYGVFGAAYEVMLRNDPHDPRSDSGRITCLSSRLQTCNQ